MSIQANLGMNGKSAAAKQPRRTAAAPKGLSPAKKPLSPDAQKLSDGRVMKYRLQRAAQKLLPEWSVACCHRHSKERLTSDRVVDINLHRNSGKASFGNLVTCGSVWVCPVCGAKISEGRREELQTGMAFHIEQSGTVAMATYTVPHIFDQSLEHVLKRLSEALSRMKSWAAYKKIMKQVGSKGAVRSLEVTYGQNGWHPHAHELIFCDSRDDLLETLEQIRALWEKAVRLVGLGQINEHGFKVHNGDYAAEYVAKFGREAQTQHWGAASELTRFHSKKGVNKNRTPFDLLRDYLFLNCAQSGALFVEYAEAFKGKRQLFYSPGLKKHLGLKEVSDDELALDPEGPEVELIGSLDFEAWKTVLRHDARGEVLTLAELRGFGAVLQFVALLKAEKGRDVPYFSEQKRRVFGGLLAMKAYANPSRLFAPVAANGLQAH